MADPIPYGPTDKLKDPVGAAVFVGTAVVISIGYSFIETKIGTVPRAIDLMYHTMNGIIGYGTLATTAGDR